MGFSDMLDFADNAAFGLVEVKQSYIRVIHFSCNHHKTNLVGQSTGTFGDAQILMRGRRDFELIVINGK